MEVSITKGWVRWRAARSESREWPIRIVEGVRRERRRVWMSSREVVTSWSLAGVMPEYLSGFSRSILKEGRALTG